MENAKKAFYDHNKYFPVYNPISMTYWLMPIEALEEIFTKYNCKEIKEPN